MVRLPILFSFLGTVIGASFFALPFIFQNQNLYVATFILTLLFLVVTYTNYIYAEIVVKTHSSHHLPGYVEIYLGQKLKILTTLMAFLGGLGSNLAYIIISISFIQILIPSINENLLAIGIMIFVFVTTFNGSIFKGSEKILTILLIALLMFLSFYLIFSTQPINTIKMLSKQPINYAFILPALGITLSANAGFGILPELKQEIKKANRLLTIIGNASIPLLLYILFITGVLGTGKQITQDSLTGLTSVVPSSLIFTTVLIGLLAILTSFESNVLISIDTLRRDFALSKIRSTITVLFIPIVLFLIGAKDLVVVLSIVGGIFTAFTHFIIHIVGIKVVGLSTFSKISILVLVSMIIGEFIRVTISLF